MAEETKELLVEIERILPGGYGLAHAEGLTLFVALAAPGDVLRVEITRRQRKVAFATIKQIVKPSSVRVEAPCPYFGRCGGCDFQQLNYEAQLNAKVEIVRDCLHRIAGLKELPDITIERSPNEWQYRARAKWQVDRQRNRFGYFEGASHRVCDIEFCAVLEPALEEVLESLRSELHERVGDEFPSDVDAVAGDDGVSISPPLRAYQTVDVSRTIDNERFEFNARSFFQVNHQLLETLLKHSVDDSKGDLAVDLYCGVGLFTVPLARRFKKVLGIESNAASVAFARRNVKNAGMDNAEFYVSTVAEWLSRRKATSEAIDFLLLDPPRTGAEPGAVEGILKLKPTQLCYVSCDPATLARDLKQLVSGGFAVESVAAFDMFPQTHHVETVVKLRRG